MSIVVKPESEIVKKIPDVILILAWNFKEEIVDKVRNMLRSTGKKVTFVVPIPKVEII